MKLDTRRQKVIEEALTWIGTPFHHAARIKGAGVDCLTFITEVYERVGIIEHQELPFYRPDFMNHRAEDSYLYGLLKYGQEVKAPLAADVAIFKWGRIHAHAGIVIDWPLLIHAAPALGVIKMRGDTGRLNGRPVKFISAFKDQE